MADIKNQNEYFVELAASLLTDLAAKFAAVGLEEQVVARAAHLSFLQVGGDIVGHPALVTWLRDSADRIERRLLASMDLPLQ
jgi:hypothetical protein